MRYALKFLDSSEEMVRALNIEATDHDSAISYSCAQSIYFDMPIELWRERPDCTDDADGGAALPSRLR